MIPNQPRYLLKTPFAQNGNREIPPATKENLGRASLAEGFPTETQLPLNEGGVAPNRLDFQGVLYTLSAFAHWFQSGGAAVYSADVGYTTPNIVFHNNILWWCVKDNGPQAAAGNPDIVEPGMNALYWIPLRDYLLNSGGSSGGGLVPVGGLIMYYGAAAPAGYLACDGVQFSASDYPLLFAHLQSNRAPDFRGLAPRGYDPAATRDPDGASRAIGSMQQDAGIKVTGKVHYGQDADATGVSPTGAFYFGPKFADTLNYMTWTNNVANSWYSLFLDSSRQWGDSHTATEFRGKNFSILYAIKHD